MAATERVTIKALVERRVAEAAVADPAVLARLAADPDSVVRPILAEVLGDDGALDLGSITTSVHVNTPSHLHFVVDLDVVETARRELAEVSGFVGNPFGLGGSVSLGVVEVPIGRGDEAFRRSKDWRKCLTTPPGCPDPTTLG